MQDGSGFQPPTLPYQFPIDLDRPHPFSVYDMVRTVRLETVVPSPRGDVAVAVAEEWDPETDRTTRNLWLVHLDGSGCRRLTNDRGIQDGSPTWSSDGATVFFVSNRSGSNQIWAVGLDGTLYQVSDLPIEVGFPKCSPCSDHLAFACRVYPGDSIEQTAARLRRLERSPVKARLYRRLFVRHWDSWQDGRYWHLFVVPLRRSNGEWRFAGQPVDLMNEFDADSPIPPFGTARDYAWSPDGEEIAFTVHMGDDRAWSTNLDVFTVRVEDGRLQCITADNPAVDMSPMYSPDGRYIAYLSMNRPGYESDRRRVRLYDRTTGRTTTITEDWDRSPNSVCWSTRGDYLYVTVDDEARRRIYRVQIRNHGQPEPLVRDGFCADLSCIGGPGGDRLVYLHDCLQRPAEVFVFDLGQDRAPRRVSDFNTAQFSHVEFPAWRDYWFEGAGGDRVHAFLVEPLGREPDRRYPLVVLVHGGPQGVISDHFHYRWHPLVYGAAGFTVLAINFHGSVGFGQRFTDAVCRDWGGKPFEDVMKGVDAVLRDHDWIDGDALAAIGASYGGWMVNWIAGQTDRFRCLVNHAGPFDEFYGYFETDELWFPEWEHGGVPWERPELFDRFSPSRFVHRWNTPMLVIHGGRDYRVPETDGIATFTALQRRGIPSAFLYFPDENHWVQKRLNSIVWHETVLDWLKQWLRSST